MTGSIRAAASACVALAVGAAVLLGTAEQAPAVRAGAGAPHVLAPRADSVAERKRTVDRQLDDVRESLEGSEKDVVEAAVALKRAELELDEARAALVQAQKVLAEARRRDEALAAQLRVAEAEVGKATTGLAQQQAAERETHARLGVIARQAYSGNGLTGLSLALSVDSPEQLGDRMAASATAMRIQDGAIDRLAVQRAELAARRAKLDALREQVAELKRQSARTVRAREAAEKNAAAAASRVESLVRGRAKALKVIKAKRDAEKRRVDALAKEQKHLKAVLRARARAAARAAAARARRHHHHSGGGGSGGGGGASSGGGYLSMPASGPISSGFGYRIHPIFHYRRLHTGTDFAVACGTPVRAAASGRILLAGRAGGYGNRVVIDHGVVRGVGLATTYNHLSRIVRHSGHVSRGQLIAYSGTTGSSTGCHLHFEVLVNGSFVNPMGWL